MLLIKIKLLLDLGLEFFNKEVMLKEYKSKEVDSIIRKYYITKEYSILEQVWKYNISKSSKLEDNSYNTKELIKKYFKKLQL